MSRLYAKRLYIWVREYLSVKIGKFGGTLKGEEVAKETGLDRATISRWKEKGTLSIESLVTALTKLGLDIPEILPLPPRSSRVLEGYRAAMSWLQGRELVEEETTVLVSLWSKESWMRSDGAVTGEARPKEARIALLRGLFPGASQELIERLERLDDEWQPLWRECRKAIGDILGQP